MSIDFCVITGQTVHSIIFDDVHGCTRRIEEAYLAHDDGKTINPDSYFLLFPEKPRNRIIALPASIGGEVGVSGIKWIASYPDNIQRSIPRASAVLVLNDQETGYPFACLESSVISASRTAASAALAARWMNQGNQSVKTLGIVGNGLIARYIYDFLISLGWTIDELLLHDLSRAESERFATRATKRNNHRRVACVDDCSELIKASDCIVFATVAAKPYVDDPACFAHNPLVLNISLRDLSPEILLGSYNIVDDIEHVMKANTSPHLAERMSGGRSFVTGTLAQLMRGKCRIDRDRPVIFSPFGLGILDLAVGKWVYDIATSRGEQIMVPNFFYDMER